MYKYNIFYHLVTNLKVLQSFINWKLAQAVCLSLDPILYIHSSAKKTHILNHSHISGKHARRSSALKSLLNMCVYIQIMNLNCTNAETKLSHKTPWLNLKCRKNSSLKVQVRSVPLSKKKPTKQPQNTQPPPCSPPLHHLHPNQRTKTTSNNETKPKQTFEVTLEKTKGKPKQKAKKGNELPKLHLWTQLSNLTCHASITSCKNLGIKTDKGHSYIWLYFITWPFAEEQITRDACGVTLSDLFVTHTYLHRATFKS